ncbi:hypothetical protein GCM10009123_08950 [Kangiella japonica]|uniref:Uncharacterized protein n=1 Tax=Kangiella japonica TaxID=647384 RepID=A0ABN0SWE6_9GAMM
MSKFTVIAGSFPTGTGRFTIRNFTLPGDENHYLCETVPAQQIDFLSNHQSHYQSLLDINDTSKELLESTSKGKVIFLAKLKDGRSFVAMADHTTFNKILKALERETDVELEISSSAA